MNQDPPAILSKKRDLPLKQFFLFPADKQVSTSPTRAAEPKYFFNSNYLVQSTKNVSQNAPVSSSSGIKLLSQKSVDRSTDQAKKQQQQTKIKIIPRQNFASTKQLIIKDFNACSPPKDLKTLTTVSQSGKSPTMAERQSVALEPINCRNNSGMSPTCSSQAASKFTKLRIVSRDKTSAQPQPPTRQSVVQKEPLFIKKQADRVSPKTKQRIDFCVKLDRLVAVKSRSNDVKKPENSVVTASCINTKKKNSIASEDKDQTRHILNDKGLKSIEAALTQNNHSLAHPVILCERKDLLHNRFYQSLKSRYQESEEVGQVAAQIRAAFSNWRTLKTIDFFAFKTSLDFYKIKCKIGKGCFGKVYLATQILTGCDVALKVIAKTNIRNKDSRRKIEKEVAILKQVNNSRFVIKLLEVFEDEQSVYLVFEHLPNGDLVQYFKKKPLFDEPELAPFFMKICKGVEYLHGNRILHRDIKLDNILLDRTLQPKLCDFGISSIVEEGVRIYDTGGTPAYLAPEVIKAEGQVCEKSDVWSLGVLLYLLTFGVVPFKANDMQLLYNKIIIGTYKFPDLEDTSRELVDLIRKMIVVDIDKRLSMEQVMKHQWFRGIAPEVTQEFNLLEERDESVMDSVAGYLHLVGFPDDYIAKTQSKGVFNHVKACVDTLRAKFLKI